MKIISNQNGSLLISLIVSLGIVTILMVVAIPNLRQYQSNSSLTSAARTLAIDLRYAQQLSITNQNIHGIIINDVSDFYQLVEFDLATTTIKTISLPPDVSFTSVMGFSNNFIKFNSYGSVSQSGTVELTITGGDSKTINIRPSGYVQLQ